MLNIFRSVSLNRFLLSLSLSSFAITQAIPLHAVPQINVQNVAAMIRLEKAVKKFMKSEKKDANAIIKALKGCKKEIEIIFNIKLNTNEALNHVINENIRQGIGVSDRQFDIYKSMLKKNKIISKGHKDNDKQEEKEMSSYLVFGVTCSLVGFFLICTRIPVLVTWGERMVTTGLGACAKALSDANDDNNQRRKEEEERERERNKNRKQPNWV